MQRHQQNAQTIFEYLNQQPLVANIYFPGNPDNSDFSLAKQQMAGFGAMISFELQPGIDPEKFVENLKLITLAESLGALESLIEIPAKMTHGAIPRDIRLANGIQDELIRLSVGVEDIDDLITDLDQSFKQLKS